MDECFHRYPKSTFKSFITVAFPRSLPRTQNKYLKTSWKFLIVMMPHWYHREWPHTGKLISPFSSAYFFGKQKIDSKNLKQNEFMKYAWQLIQYLEYYSWAILAIALTERKMSKYGVFSVPYFPVFRLKIRIRKNSVFGHFSRSACFQIFANQPWFMKCRL